MKTASGRQAVLINAREAAYGYDQRVEAFGSRGMAVSENRRPHHMVLSGADFTDHAAPLLNFFIERYREAFDAEIDAFVDAVENGHPVAVGYNDGRQALVLAEAALKSLHEGAHGAGKRDRVAAVPMVAMDRQGRAWATGGGQFFVAGQSPVPFRRGNARRGLDIPFLHSCSQHGSSCFSNPCLPGP
ncbi:hypothetical protein RAA17_13640 [Komagataeibacter rhaeticus]|nr:hypothetical protein [Komagataeibacter rhaeticus]